MSKIFLFVYNANSDIWSKSLDMAHKIISPSTYSCNLCNLTHGNFLEKKIWKDFRENTKADLVFMYRNEFLKSYREFGTVDFPVILEEKQEGFNIVVDSEELALIGSVEILIEVLEKRI